MIKKLSTFLLLFPLATIAFANSVNTAGNQSVYTDRLTNGTQNVAHGKDYFKNGDSFVAPLPSPSMSDIGKLVTSPSFICRSGYNKNGLVCTKTQRMNATMTCKKPDPPKGWDAPQCTENWYQSRCELVVRCGAAGGNGAGGGGSMGEKKVKGNNVYTCPSTYKVRGTQCERKQNESATPRCNNGWRLGFGGYVCHKS